MKDFIHKTEYMQESMSGNTSHEDFACTAVYLSFFVSPLWIPVRCNDAFKRSFFLCEMHNKTISTYDNVTDLPTRIACQHDYTYINGFCWTIVTNTKPMLSYSFHLELLHPLLASWSLGNAHRSLVALHVTTSSTRCLKTTDFMYQRLKDWKTVDCTNPKYTLVRKIPWKYYTGCHGTLCYDLSQISCI